MPYEGCEQVFAFSQHDELAIDGPAQVFPICWSEIGQPRIFGMVPNAFIWIEFGGVGWKLMRPDPGMTPEERLHEPGSVVDVDPVPDDRQGTLDLPGEQSEEPHDVLCFRISVVFQEFEIEAEPVASRTYGDRTDRGDSIVPTPTLLDRGLSSRGKRSPHKGREHEA